MHYKLILSAVALFLLKFSFAQEKTIISGYSGEEFAIEYINETTFNIKTPIQLNNLHFVAAGGNHYLFKNDVNWILSRIDLRDTLLVNAHINEYYDEGLELINFPIALFDSVLEIGYNGWIVSQNNNYFILDNQNNLTKIETEKKPHLLTFNYIYQSDKENDFKYVVKDIYNHNTISEIEADSILFLPTDWIHYLVISNKNKKSLIDFKSFTSVFDSIQSFKALDFNTFIAYNNELLAFYHPELGLLRYGLSTTTNFKLIGQQTQEGNEYIKSGISFDFENGSGILTLDGQLKFLKRNINDSISIYEVDYDSNDKIYQIINKNTAEIIVDNINDFEVIDRDFPLITYRTFEEIYDANDQLMRMIADYRVFSPYGTKNKELNMNDAVLSAENYFSFEIPVFNKPSLINMFKINTKLILEELSKHDDKKLAVLFSYIFLNDDRLSNEDRIKLLTNLITKQATNSELYNSKSELYYFRSKLFFELKKIKEASIDIDSSLFISESFENILRRSQFNFMYFNTSKKNKKSIINKLKFLVTAFETPNKINYSIYDLYWIMIDLMIQYKMPKQDISEYILKLDELFKNNPTLKDNIVSNDIKKLNELKVTYKIKN